MLTKAKFLKEMKNGNLMEVRKELVRYGTITHDRSWDEEKGFYKGANRVTYFTYYGLHWSVKMLNGEVRSIGFESDNQNDHKGF